MPAGDSVHSVPKNIPDKEHPFLNTSKLLVKWKKPTVRASYGTAGGWVDPRFWVKPITASKKIKVSLDVGIKGKISQSVNQCDLMQKYLEDHTFYCRV